PAAADDARGVVRVQRALDGEVRQPRRRVADEDARAGEDAHAEVDAWPRAQVGPLGLGRGREGEDEEGEEEQPGHGPREALFAGNARAPAETRARLRIYGPQEAGQREIGPSVIGATLPMARSSTPRSPWPSASASSASPTSGSPRSSTRCARRPRRRRRTTRSAPSSRTWASCPCRTPGSTAWPRWPAARRRSPRR